MPDVGLCCIIAVTSLLSSGPHCAMFGCHFSQVPKRSVKCEAGHFRIRDLFYSADVLVLEGTKQGPGEVSTKHTETLSLI